MRRTMTTTKGFRAPRPRGSHEQPAETTVSSTNSAAPPPPPSASSARKVSTRGSTLAVPSPSPSSSSAYCRKSPSRCKKASTIAAATGDAGAGTTAFDPKSGGLSFPQGPRGVLSGHFSANHLRRAPRQTDQATPRDGASNTATAMRAPADTTTVATAAAQHTAARASGDDRVVALSSSNTPLLRKRPRSLSPDDPYAGGAHHRDEPASTRGCAPSASRDSNRVKSDDTTLVQLSIPRLPTARRLSTSRIRRTVFYPPSAEQPLALLRSSHDADGAGAMGAPESAPVPRVSSAPAPADVCVAADYTVHVHPWGSATAVPAWTGASDAVPVAPGADALRVPGANSAVCVGREPHSSTAVSEHHKTPLAAAMTASTILSPSTRSGKRFLSAMEHEQRDYAAAISPAPPSLTSSSLLPPYRSPCHSGASEQHTKGRAIHPSITTPAAAALRLHISIAAVPQLRVHDLAALSLPSLSREASLLPSNSRRGLSVPLSSPRLERAESPLSPLLADSSPAPAIGLMRGQAGALVAAAAAGGERQTLSSLASPARSVGELARVQQQQASTHPSSALAAAEEAEREECDEALECEMAEDLRMSTDIAFTPSGTGSCAPPLFSQSSMMQEEERQAEEEGGGEGATYIMRDSAVAVERADDDSELRSGPGMSGHEGSAQPLFRFQDGAGDRLQPRRWHRYNLFEYHAPSELVGSAVQRLRPPAVCTVDVADPCGYAATSSMVLAPGTELLPLGVVTAAVAADGATSVQPSVTTTTDQACAGSARNVAASVAEPATPVSSPPSEACATKYPPDLWLPSLPAEHVSPPRDPLLMRVPSQDGKAEGCAAHGVSQMGVVAPTPMSPGSDALSSATGVSALSAANAAPPLSDLYVTALPYLAAAAAGGSGAPAVPARPGRTCFTLHSAARTTGTLSSSAAATSTQLPGHGAVPRQGTEGPTASLDGVRSATPRATRKVPSSMESRHTTGCAQQVIANAQPALLRPVDSTPATVVMHRTPSTLTSEEPAWSRRSAPFPQPWPLLNDGYPPALLTVAPVTPLVGCMGAETPTVAAPQSAQAPVAHDEAAQPYPRESREMLFYDLPREVGHFYATRRGVTSLYDWQHDVLTRPEVRQGGNLSTTLVAELSLLRCVLNRRKSCFLVLPFVSLAEEKTMALQPLTTAYDFNVDGHYGSSGRFPLCGAPAVYVCTIEKANSLLNHMLEEGRADEIGAVVVDELHMVGESGRGATLELFLSKVLVINAARQRKRDAVVAPATQSRCSASGSRPGWPEELEDAEEDLRERTAMTDTTKAAADPGPLQIIGMSATVSNLRTLAEWLRAACFEYDFRPVPLHAYSVVGGLVLRDGQRNERNLSGGSVTQHLVELVTEVPDASVLIFCASRQQCVDTAKGIVNCLRAQAIAGQKAPSAWVSGSSDAAAEAQHVSVLGVPFPSLTRGPATAAAMAAVPSQASAAIKGLLADLEALAHHEASQLSEVIAFGVAFHHGGLLAEERDLIETAFRRKHIRILCCTSTLAAGVNLPARRVIIKTPYVGREFLTKSRYLQMCGRAGRAGLDTYGESFLLLSSRDQARGHALMHAAVEPCCSKLLEDDQTLTRSLLECVGVGLVADFQSACQWSGSLLSRWAVGPVDVSWQPHIPAAAAPAASASTGVAPPGAAAKGTCESVTGLFLASEVGYDGDAAAAQDSESSRGGSNGAGGRAAAGAAVCKDSGTTSSVALETLPSGVSDDAHADASAETHDACHAQVHVTSFGSSSVRSCFSVEEALLLRAELDELRHTGLILSDDLHLCYFLTPLREVGKCDWELLRLMMSRMSDSRQRIASLLGVDAYFVDQQAMGLGGPLQATEEGRRRLFTARRFYVALMLADVLAEVPMATVEQRYNVSRGQLQNLMRSASMFSSSITSFCHAMEWFSLEAVLSSFVKRLGFGVKPDLLPLMEIRGMQPPRARALWNAGFKKVAAIAAADADDMVSKVKLMNPKDSKAAKFFTKRSALMAIREANLALQSQIKEKKGELQELTVCCGGGGGVRGVR
ncbi:Helicase conserved C-terminal domain family protein [Leishmania donovani]|uniref:Helicase conserved C-terminal domain family protein n=1 Tax=Leishmania donovani TaxID=5661 RepID=A0A504Y1H5_LEIDO|nr:Helicase conserved C-terminal domain family protein [Leishmania donovani]